MWSSRTCVPTREPTRAILSAAAHGSVNIRSTAYVCLSLVSQLMLSVDVASFEQTIGCNRAERHCAQCLFLLPWACGLLGHVAAPITNNSCVKCVSVTAVLLLCYCCVTAVLLLCYCCVTAVLLLCY